MSSEGSYFDQVSAQLESTVGAQVSGVVSGVSENSEAGVSPSVNALDTGLKAAAALGGLADGVCEAAAVPVLASLGLKGQACLPVSKQLDPVIGVDIHLVNMPPATSVPMPHPYMGVLLCPQDFLTAAVCSYIPPPGPAPEGGDADSAKLAEVGHTALTMAVGMLGATVKIGSFIPRAVASTPTRSIPHVPMGAGFAANSLPIPKDNGHAFMGSLTVLADGLPLSGGGAHLHLDCNDLGMASVHKVPGRFLPTGVINPIPPARPVLTSPVPVPLNPMAAVSRKCMGAFGRLYKKKTEKAAMRLHDAVNRKIKSDSLKGMLHKTICTVTGHPVDVASGTFFTDEEDFWLDGPVPLSWERTWYSRSEYRGPLGNGWHHAYDMGVVAGDGTLTLRMADGIPVAFPLPTEEKPSFLPSERKEARREKDGYCVWDLDEDLYYRFTQKEYDSVRLLESVSDANGFAIRLAYDGKGRLQGITDSAGRHLSVECDPESGRITEIRGPHPENAGEEIMLASYEYDADGNLVCQRNAVGDAMRYGYAGRLIVKETWRNGLNWFFEYDGTEPGARCVHTWGDGGIYDHKLKYLDGVTEVLDSHDRLTVYRHKNGLVCRKTGPTGEEYRWKYSVHRRLLRETDAAGGATRYRYDRWGNCTDMSGPDGGSVSAAFFRKGGLRNRPVSVTTADGGTWTFAYDAKGNLTERTNPEGAKTRIRYAGGLAESVTDPYGVVTRLSYDAMHNLTGASDSRGNASGYRYDLLGRCTRVTNPKGAVQERRYDDAGRVTEVDDFDGNHIRLKYDGIDNLLEYRDDLQTVEYAYSGMWKLTHRRDSRGVVAFRYDREERLVHVVNERMQRYEFELDAAGNVIAETGFDRGRRTYLRDRAGRVASETLPSGIVREYGYDNASRVTRVSYVTTDEPDQTYRYGISGRLAEAARGESRVEFAYNALGLPVTETADGETITRTYDKTGRILSLQSTLGANLEYIRNGFGELAEFRAGDGIGSGEMPWKSQHRYDTLGFEVERLLPGGVMRSFGYADIGRLVDARTRKDARTRHLRRYRWGKADRLLATEDSRYGTARYGYAPNGQLEHAGYGDGTEQWRKSDSVGNLYPDPDCTVRRFLKGGAMEQDGKWHCEYDKDGNLTERYIGTGRWLDGKKEHWRYRWNADGSLAKVIRPDGKEVAFEYDALGRRLSKSFGTTVTRWMWNGNVPLHQWRQKRVYSREQDAWLVDGKRRERTLWLFEEESFVPAAMIREGRACSIVTDHLGTPTQAYDADGNEVWSRVLDMNGEVVEETGNVGMVPFLFQGQYYDRETGMAYNRFRYYSPQMGMYISQDPIGLNGGITNIYAYVYNTNTWIDILGLNSTDLNKALGGSRKGMQAHHLIPEKIWKKNEAFLNSIGLAGQMDSASNGLHMYNSEKGAIANGKAYYHVGRHDVYSNAVDISIAKIQQEYENNIKFKGMEESKAQIIAKKQILKLQDLLRKKLNSDSKDGSAKRVGYRQ
ncbi:AHH domain-containing protein [Phocaeicola coprophilus]|nr:AHH domain-containing protein [Phocaeicola coprophilus]